MDRDAHQPFTGRRLLIVEDELLIALELQRIVEQLGGTAVGPAGSVEGALKLLSETTPDAALLDANLRESRVTPVAQACRVRRIPFALATGYGRLELETSKNLGESEAIWSTAASVAGRIGWRGRSGCST